MNRSYKVNIIKDKSRNYKKSTIKKVGLIPYLYFYFAEDLIIY